MITLDQIKGNLQKSVYDYLINFCPEDQKNINDEEAENALIYGIECYRIKFNKFYKCEICLSYIDDNVLDFYNKEDLSIKNIQLDRISNISFRHLDKISQFYNFDKNYNFICEILVKSRDYKFFFKERKTVLLFVKGLIIKSRKIYENYNSHVNISIDKFNENFNDELDEEELGNLATYLGIDPTFLKDEIDKNKDNTVSMNEFRKYLKEKVSGEQFRPIFEKYSTLIYNNKERVMGPIDLQNFFKECEKDEISYLEACQIIIEFNPIKDNVKKMKCIQSFEDLLLSHKAFNSKDIESIMNQCNTIQISNSVNSVQTNSLRLFLTLYDFNMMLNSMLLTVYDKNKLNKPLDIDHPLTDYFIKSSHNTYLTGHQLIGKSSSKMYSTSLLYNFRMVELDCYEGEGDEIVITHGYTLVDNLSLDAILIELKETAFINSDLPVILSIENHLGNHHQEVMLNKLKNILKDLYIFPRDVKPDFLPSLRDLKKKFLIKCGGRKLWENEIIPKKQQIKQVNNLNSSGFSMNQIINNSNKLIEKKVIFLTNTHKNKSLLRGVDTLNLKRTKNLVINKKRGEEQAIQGLEKILGIIGVKYVEEKINSNYYKPWEMMTIKCSKATKFSENIDDRKKIINLTQHCLLRIYPENFDSTNYNMIKCFACGIQGCCLNIQQTEDDFALYNKIFFKQNRDLGYVLKPERFLSQQINSCLYDKANYICNIQILSLINISKLIEEVKGDVNQASSLNLCIYTIGVKEDEDNLKYVFKLINGSLFPTFQNGNPNVKFYVFDYDFSAIMIKIKLGNVVIGRGCIPYFCMKLGYRRIPIYDNHCFNMKDVYMVGHFTLDKI